MSDQSTSNPYDAPPTEAGGEMIPETRAKQGRRGYHVLAVLVVSLMLVLGAFGVIFATHVHTASDATPAAAAANAHAVARGSTT